MSFPQDPSVLRDPRGGNKPARHPQRHRHQRERSPVQPHMTEPPATAEVVRKRSTHAPPPPTTGNVAVDELRDKTYQANKQLRPDDDRRRGYGYTLVLATIQYQTKEIGLPRRSTQCQAFVNKLEECRLQIEEAEAGSLLLDTQNLWDEIATLYGGAETQAMFRVMHHFVGLTNVPPGARQDLRIKLDQLKRVFSKLAPRDRKAKRSRAFDQLLAAIKS